MILFLKFLAIALIILTGCFGQGRAKAETIFSVAVPDIELLLHKNKSGNWSGPLTQSLDTITSKTHIDFEYIVVTFPRAVRMVENGAANFGVFLRTEKRDQIANPLTKLGDVHYLVVSRADHPINRTDELSSLKVGRIQSGTKAIPLEFIPNENLSLYRQHKDLVKALLVNRVQAIVIPDFRFIEAIDDLDISPNKFSKPFKVMSREMWMYSSKKNSIETPVMNTIKENVSINALGLFNDLIPASLK